MKNINRFVNLTELRSAVKNNGEITSQIVIIIRNVIIAVWYSYNDEFCIIPFKVVHA